MNARKLKRIRPERKIATLKELAQVNFQPVEPGQRSDMTDTIKYHADIMILAFGVLNQSKEKLTEMWVDDFIQEGNQHFVEQLKETQKWLKDFNRILRTAEMRMLAAAAASLQKQKVARAKAVQS